MLSLSDNEFSVLGFLVRNFAERLTIRSIAQRLNFSAAGVFNILKKLEKEGIVTGEKLGTGLFYSINFENKVAAHLAAIGLLVSDDKFEKIDSEKLKQAKAAIFDKKTLILVTDSVTTVEVEIPNVSVMVKSEDDLMQLFRKKNPDVLNVLKKGIVLFGEEHVVEIIKNCISRF